MMKFLVTMAEGEIRNSFFTERSLGELRKHGEVILHNSPKDPMGKDELMEKIGGVDVLFTGWSSVRMDKDILDCADALKIHAHTGGSVAPYICREEYDRGILVLSGNDLYAKSVAEGCLAYTLMSLRRNNDYLAAIREGGWRPENERTEGLIGKKVGLVGFGAITRYFAQLLQWFDVDLRIASKYISDEELASFRARRATKKDIFETCDVISLHSALNDANRGMITASLIQSIKDGALFVNTARAGLVDNDALIGELEKNRFNAVIDVYDEEPLPVESPFRTMPNVLAFGHMAGPTFDMREQVVLALLRDALNFQKGIACKNIITYEYGSRMTV